jgi:cytochrome c oxidase subunit 1
MASATHDTHASHGGEPNYLENNQGKGKLWSWMSTLDHKRIGLMYLFGILFALLLGGAFALLVRLELFSPGQTIVGKDTYNQFFTLHGAVMVFLVIIPGIPAALGNIMMPVHARREGRGVPAAQPRQLLPVVHRRPAAAAVA